MTRWLPIGLLVFALGPTGCTSKKMPNGAGGKTVTGPVIIIENEKPKVDRDVVLSVDAEALAKEFSANYETAGAKYAGRTVQVAGAVTNIFRTVEATVTDAGGTHKSNVPVAVGSRTIRLVSATNTVGLIGSPTGNGPFLAVSAIPFLEAFTYTADKAEVFLLTLSGGRSEVGGKFWCNLEFRVSKEDRDKVDGLSIGQSVAVVGKYSGFGSSYTGPAVKRPPAGTEEAKDFSGSADFRLINVTELDAKKKAQNDDETKAPEVRS